MLDNKEIIGTGAKKSTHSAGLLIFALVMLFNPNINLFDILPDFIGYFILARFFEKAADCAPYFEEARSAFVKLGFVNLLKIPAIVIMMTVRAGNTQDNDVVALMALVFATAEIILLVPAVKNIFDALSYLGSRTEAKSLIKSDSLVSTDSLRSFTLVFSIFKCAIYALPEMLRLTRSVELNSGTYVATGSDYYIFAVLASLILGFVVGGVWLARMKKYVRAIKAEGKFAESLASLASESSLEEYAKKCKYRSLSRTFFIFVLAATFSLDLTFKNYSEINLLPGFIFGGLMLLGLIKLSAHTKGSAALKRLSVICGLSYVTLSVITYIFSFNFLSDYGYSALTERSAAAAHASYRTVVILTSVETLCYLALIVVFALMMRKFTTESLGIHPSSASYRPSDKAYHKEINVKTVILSVIAALAGLLNLAKLISDGNVQLIFTNENDVTMPVIPVGAFPWLGLVLTVVTVIYIFYSVYYFGYIKDEIKDTQ